MPNNSYVGPNKALYKNNWPTNLRGYSVGRDCYLLLSTDNGSTFTEITIAKNVTFNFQTDNVDSSCKRTGFIKEKLPTFSEISIEAEMLFNTNEPICGTIMSIAKTRESFQLGAYTDSGEGALFYAFMSNLGRPENLDDVVRLNGTFQLIELIQWGLPSTIIL